MIWPAVGAGISVVGGIIGGNRAASAARATPAA